MIYTEGEGTTCFQVWVVIAVFLTFIACKF